MAVAVDGGVEIDGHEGNGSGNHDDCGGNHGVHDSNHGGCKDHQCNDADCGACNI